MNASALQEMVRQNTTEELNALLSIPSFAPFAQKELAFRAENAQKIVDTIKAEGYTFKDGSHLDYVSLLVFVQATLGVYKNREALKDTATLAQVLEAREALATLMPSKRPWMGLQNLIDEATALTA